MERFPMNFVDTSVFLALYLEDDQYHDAAVREWARRGRSVATSNHVLDEMATTLARRAGYRFATDRVAEIYSAPTIEIVQSTREDELEALSWMRKYADQGVSFTDCTSFAIMQRRRIRAALTFDRHFRAAGFSVFGLA
ncbi:MAG TPA: PIN domain-containing protein [Bryobacteraceae bacterium]